MEYMESMMNDRLEASMSEYEQMSERIKQLEQQLERIAKYPATRGEELSIESARDIARSALAAQANANDQQVNASERQVQQEPVGLNAFIQKHVYIDGKDSWTYNSLASSAQDFIDSAVLAYDSQVQQEPIGEVQHYAAPANLPAYVNVKWYGKPPKNGAKVYALPPAPIEDGMNEVNKTVSANEQPEGDKE